VIHRSQVVDVHIPDKDGERFVRFSVVGHRKRQKGKGKREKAKGKRQKGKGKREKAKGKRQRRDGGWGMRDGRKRQKGEWVTGNG
jgi:hypothetical protein